jgi:hypothetical protein
MSEMVERVARTIWDEWSLWGSPIREAKPNWADLTADQQGIGRRIARAAIEAMREPSPAMHRAGAASVGSAAGRVWHAMIDTALKD